MSITTDFTHVQGVARVDWTLETETPLCIKAGSISAYSRDKGIDFAIKKTGHNSEGSVSDFYFDIRFSNVAQDIPQAVFCVPASSVRGALRSFTIKRLVPKAYWGATLFEKKDDPETTEEKSAEQVSLLKDALHQPGWHLIQNLFGLAADTGNESLANETVTGRLKVMTDNMLCIADDLNSEKSPFCVVSRSPLDRATRGTKDGGLHSFMELAPGYPFKIQLQIINPVPADLGFIAFWEKAINQGLLRLGGLSGIGKGRLRLQESSVTLFSRDTNGFNLPPEASALTPETKAKDILWDLFPENRIAWAVQKSFYLNTLKNHFEQLKKENSHAA